MFKKIAMVSLCVITLLVLVQVTSPRVETFKTKVSYVTQFNKNGEVSATDKQVSLDFGNTKGKTIGYTKGNKGTFSPMSFMKVENGLENLQDQEVLGIKPNMKLIDPVKDLVKPGQSVVVLKSPNGKTIGVFAGNNITLKKNKAFEQMVLAIDGKEISFYGVQYSIQTAEIPSYS